MAGRPVRALARTFAVVLLATASGSIACVAQRITIAGNAMAPTLKEGDWAIAVRHIAEIRRGDIVAFKYPLDETKSLVERIVALPGEQIEMKDGRVSVNGRPIEEPYVVDANRSSDTMPPRLMGPNQYFVMGDNRKNSSDSRTWGPVTRNLIWARVMER